MSETTLSAEQLIQAHVEGMAMRGDGPFEDPAAMNRYCEVLTRRGEQWASSVLARDLSRRSLTWGPWLNCGEPEILIAADRAEDRS